MTDQQAPAPVLRETQPPEGGVGATEADGPTVAGSPRLPGPLGRARTQALGVLALALSVSVVVLVVFVLPHDGPSGSRHGRGSGPPATLATVPTITTTPSSTPTSSVPATAPRSTTTQPSTSVVHQVTSGAGTGGGNTIGTGTPVVVPEATTTTTTAPTTTTTDSPPPTYTPPHVGSQSWPGNLDDPYTSATYQVTTSGGVVSATATWSGTPTLTLEVACPGATQSGSGTSGLYVSADASAESCSITLAEPAGTSATVSYTLTASYPTQ